MKKNFKRLLTLCLAIAMVASLSVGAFAASSSNVKQYKNYVVIGDSIPSGYGLDTVNAPDYANSAVSHGELVVASYPHIVARDVGAVSTTVLARCGFRTVETMRVLDPTYKYDSMSDTFLSMLSQVGTTGTVGDTIPKMQAAAATAIKNADLVTINLGSNDTMTYALTKLSAFISARVSATNPLLAEAKADLKEFGMLGEALTDLLTLAETLQITNEAIAVLSASMAEGCVSFKLNFASIISHIETVNPKAKIVVVGMYNPFKDLKLTDASMLKVGKLADQFVTLLNTYMSTTCLLSSTYTYVDVMGTQVYTFPALTDPTFSKVFIKNVHPDLVGHQSIANAIINKLPTASESSYSCLITNSLRNSSTLLRGVASLGLF
jgi:lysophospholipase L1-like esterase